MKRRVLSLFITLALCLNLCPIWILAADEEAGGGLCPHHPVHTDTCGYAPPASEQECTHEHDDDCYSVETNCIHEHTAECYPDTGDSLTAEEPALCTHICTQDTGCITRTLSCPHEHDDICGYVPGNPGAPCTFVCRICPIEELIEKLPDSISPDSSEQIQDQLYEIYSLYDELSADEQEQVDLSPCVSLWDQMDATGAAVLSDAPAVFSNSTDEYKLTADQDRETTYMVSDSAILSINTYILTGPSPTIQVTGEGNLTLNGPGEVVSRDGAGVEVQSGGSLTITDSDLEVCGTTHALDIASGAKVKLSGGTYSGDTAAIQTEDNDFAALLAKDCAYFDVDGKPILPSDVQNYQTVSVGPCTDHVKKNYAPSTDAPSHTWTCQYCAKQQQENCSFSLNTDGNGECVCGNKLSVTVADPDMVYDGTPKPASADVTVTLNSSGNTPQPLTVGTDYQVAYTQYTNVGEGDSKVTVTGLTFSGEFSETFTVGQDKPTLTWNTWNPASKNVTYDGSPLEVGELPNVEITIKSQIPADEAGLRNNLQYSYQKDGADIAGPPTNAGSYQVKASSPESQNYMAAETDTPLTLTIDPKTISPTVEVSQTSYVYDGTVKSPKITVMDGTTVLKEIQDYTVTWAKDSRASIELKDAGAYTATIESVADGNYNFTATAKVEIIEADQGALTITGKPAQVFYGDTVATLGTIGGAGGGAVTWSIESSTDSGVTINPDTGTLKVEGTGTFKVTAARTLANYETVSDSWTFTVRPKPVVAEVTVEDKDYDGTTTSGTINAEVKDSDLVKQNDVVKISGLAGTFADANVGSNKTVTLNSSTAKVEGKDAAKYDVSYPGEAKGNITPMEVVAAVELSGNDLQTDDKGSFYYYDGTEKTPNVTVSYTDGSVTNVIPSENYTVSYTNNKNVSLTDKPAVVTVTAKDGGNYTFTGGQVTENFEIRSTGAALITSPQARDLTYTGAAQELVTVGTATGGVVKYSLNKSDENSYKETVPTETAAGTYTVYYKVVADGNHASTIFGQVSVTIKPKEVDSPIIELSPTSYTYNGRQQEPTTVTVSDTVNSTTEIISSSEYTVSYSNNINAGTATVTIRDNNGGNYIVNGTATFEIKKANLTVTAPTAKTGLSYAGAPQALVTAGTVTGGTMEYSLDGSTYSSSLPTGTNAGNYEVYYRAVPDANHEVSTPPANPGSVTVTISSKTVTPTITLSPTSYTYDGTPKEPTVTVIDVTAVIPTGEYKVSYSDNTDVGTATVKVTDVAGGNYIITTTTKDFKITEREQAALSITQKPNTITYGDGKFTLSTSGGSGGGAVTWEIDPADSTVASVNATSGQVTILGRGTATVVAKKAGGDNYKDATASWTFTVEPKPVSNPSITLDQYSYTYCNNAIIPTVTVKNGTEEIPKGNYDAICTDNVNAGTATVTVTCKANGNYSFANQTVNFTINPKVVSSPTITLSQDSCIYNGQEQKPSVTSVEDGDEVLSSGEYTIVYDSTTNWKNAGTHKVIVQDAANGNYTVSGTKDFTIKKATPTIAQAPTAATGTEGQKLSDITLTGGSATVDGTEVPGTFAWVNGETELSISGQNKYDVTFTPTDTANYETFTCQVTVTVNAASGGGGTDESGGETASYSSSASTQTTVEDGTASTIVSTADGSKLVREAAANNSDNIVIEPKITGDVTKTEVALPASTVSRIKSETNAALTVASPIANVTIPNGALEALGAAGGTVGVVTEQVGQTVVLTLYANGEEVEDIPDGVTLTVPAADAGPGTVAVLVHEDGTREVIRKSVAGDGTVNIPLSGSATVEIVDNSKDFDDVPSTNWAADAVSFASAHELFSGTSETTFSPEEPMSRGMLATVLYNLEGRPEQEPSSEYSDVSGDAWYADSVAWAAENGITSGSGNGQFGPEDSVTREDFAVMLWKYAGSPEAGSKALDFTDADQVSSYAQEALCWAVENGVLNGCGNGQLAPGGTATRAQAVQMLKNFMENTKNF